MAAMERETVARKVGRWGLGGMLILAGISHLTFARKAFRAQVPRWVPMNADDVVVYSGVVEIALGAALIVMTKRRHVVGLVAASFFVAVFPGNVSQWRHHRDGFGLDTDTKRFVRLWFQPVLVAWALWGTGVVESCGKRLGSGDAVGDADSLRE
jgi:uncharacterized membrane protein